MSTILGALSSKTEQAVQGHLLNISHQKEETATAKTDSINISEKARELVAKSDGMGLSASTLSKLSQAVEFGKVEASNFKPAAGYTDEPITLSIDSIDSFDFQFPTQMTGNNVFLNDPTKDFSYTAPSRKSALAEQEKSAESILEGGIKTEQTSSYGTPFFNQSRPKFIIR